MTQNTPPQETHLNLARASIQQSLSWYSSFRRHWNYPPNPDLQAAVREDLQNLKASLDKLEQKVITIATFGLVSRGKSAVINALIGQNLLPTGPINGVTRWPRAVRWQPPGGKLEVELIDTPGLDEIEGEARANMAREVASQADLILFIVSGDITRTEYQALCELRESQKPLLLVFNKIDLYPETDRLQIYRQLQKLGTANTAARLEELLSPDEIVMVSAQPQPMLVKISWPDGTETQEWENPPPQIHDLKAKLLKILNQEGRTLLALNALVQAKQAETQIAQKTVKFRQQEAEEIIWKYSKYKAVAVAVNPLAVVDVIGGFITDLVMIRTLARLYGLPITSYEAGKLWKTILLSNGGLFVSEIVSNILVGMGKTGIAAVSFWENPAALTTYASTAIAQGGIAGYGSYAIGKIAEEYLKNGCSWGDLGPSLVIQEILSQIEPNTIIYRLRQEIGSL